MNAAPQVAPRSVPFLIHVKSFVRELDGTIRFWSKGAANLYGWTVSEAIGQQCHALLRTELPKPLSEIKAELLNTGSWYGELHQTHRDGRKMIILSNWALQFDNRGNPASVTENNYELADSSETQIKLKTSQQESYHRLLELEVLYRTAPVGLGFLDRELRYVRLNEALAAINGLPMEAHIGKHASEINPELAGIVVPMLSKVLASKQPLLNVELTGHSPADPGHERAWMVNFYPVSNAQTFGVSVVFQDVTILKEAEDICERFGSIVEASTDAIMCTNSDGNVSSWNRAAEKVFGYSAGEIMGKPITALATPRNADELPQLLRQLHAGDKAPQYERVETVQRRKDGHDVDVSLSISPILNRHGSMIGAFEIVRDVTQRNRTEAALLRSNEELRQFAFAAAHDLQEPLRNIGLYAQMLDDIYKEKPDGAAKEAVTVVVESTRRMQTLIRDLLHYTRVVDVQLAQNEPVDCNEACRMALANLSSALTECDADVSAGPLPTVIAEHVHMVQLFQNLVGNALKYRAKERRAEIRVSAARNDNCWVFSVKDNGIGIKPEYHAKIFGVFKRLHGREVPGTGIGLAICKRIVDHHGGRLWLDSEPGQGSTFHFSFPDANRFAPN